MPKNLTSMKRTVEAEKEGDMAIDVNREEYSYGLRVDLRDEEIEKLKLSLPEVGSTMMMVANVKVISVRESADENGKDRNVEFQITEMKVAPYEEEETDHAAKLYSK